MYEENRLEISQESKDHREKLTSFNTKLAELHKEIVSKEVLSIEKVGDSKIDVYDKWKRTVNMPELKSEATEILELLQCSIPIWINIQVLHVEKNKSYFFSRTLRKSSILQIFLSLVNTDIVGVTFFNQWAPALQLVEKV